MMGGDLFAAPNSINSTGNSSLMGGNPPVIGGMPPMMGGDAHMMGGANAGLMMAQPMMGNPMQSTSNNMMAMSGSQSMPSSNTPQMSHTQSNQQVGKSRQISQFLATSINC